MLKTALAQGVYNTPRSVTLDDLSNIFGISKAAGHHRLQAAERKVVGKFFSHGDDVYRAGSFGANGGTIAGAGFLPAQLAFDPTRVRSGAALLDARGDDRYTAGRVATNGAGLVEAGYGGGGIPDQYAGVALLLDAAGNDVYTAGEQGANGGGVDAVTALLDGAGHDVYADPDGQCAECSALPKGVTGMQLDLPVA